MNDIGLDMISDKLQEGRRMLDMISEYLLDNGIKTYPYHTLYDFIMVTLPKNAPHALDKIEIGMQGSSVAVYVRTSGCWEPPIRIELANPNSLNDLVLVVSRLFDD